LILDDGTPMNAGERATPVADDWNGDGKIDILAGSMDGTIKVYIHKGTDSEPRFALPYHLQLADKDFDVGTRSAPRIHDWNEDGLKDILVGEVEGYVYFLKNIGTNEAPVFDRTEKLFLKNGNFVRYPGRGPRSRLFVTDWNNDGIDDLLLGGADGRVMLFPASPEITVTPRIAFNRMLTALKESLIKIRNIAKGYAKMLKNSIRQ